jgi:hypothetical protein
MATTLYSSPDIDHFAKNSRFSSPITHRAARLVWLDRNKFQ